MRLPYTSADGAAATMMPRMPLLLHHDTQTFEVIGLIDSGSAVNVLPYRVGLELGVQWSESLPPVPLVGSLGKYEARALNLWASHPELTGSTPARLVFAWVQSDAAPIIFGQMNFFLEFDVCFYRSQAFIEINRKT